MTDPQTALPSVEDVAREWADKILFGQTMENFDLAKTEKDLYRVSHPSVVRRLKEVFSLFTTPTTTNISLTQLRKETIEECAKIADGFTCGACGMDGKASAAIRAISNPPAEPKDQS